MSKQTSSLISVILPIYKGAEWLSESIESILQQKFTSFELIIVNDASPDNSYDVINMYNDKRIKYIEHSENKGLVAALNTGLQYATGKYIARMDQDDISLPHRLQLQYDYMEQHQDCVLLGTQVKVMGENKNSKMYTGSNDLKASLLFGTSFAHPCVMMRASVLIQNHIQYSEQFKHAEDYGLWTQLALHGQLANLNEVCLEYRKHASQYTKVFSEGMLLATRLIRKSYLQNLGVVISDHEINLLHDIAEKNSNYNNKEYLSKLGFFLHYLSNHFTASLLQPASVKKIAYTHWKQICSERQKTGMNSYRLFLSSPLGKSFGDLKVHAWFLKEVLHFKWA